MRKIEMFALKGIPSIVAGDDLAPIIEAAAQAGGLAFHDGDIVVVAQKIVSKAEGRLVRLAGIAPSPRAGELAAQTGKDARLVELVLRESSEILRSRPNVLIAEHRLGHIMANAGIDRSNLDADPADEDLALLLPEDPDRSAAALRSRLEAACGVRLGVIVSDSFGRPWRLGSVGIAIGIAGPAALLDRRGAPDLFGRKLQITELGYADSIAAAAVLLMGEGAEGCPVVVLRGCEWSDAGQRARDGLRRRGEDLFR
jgi:coenzyme F420-0:L-glutamate ligase/coenzyme F420-1:gamma-L-glutamate ligase